MNYVTFDIETYHPKRIEKIDPNELRVSVTGAYFSWMNKYVAFLENDTKVFLDLLQKADLVVGYNHLWFDLPVLQKYSNIDLLKLPNYDIMVELEKKIGYKMRLNELAKVNLGAEKTDVYEQFKNYYWDKNWFPLIDYCMHDVKLTNQLFEMVLRREPLKYLDLLQTKEVVLDQPTLQPRQSIASTPESIF